ncbi:hypothetical protein Cgig2_031741 [Carnegiea gigantea]|uniref:Pectinesterase inhibitor domain-containing protein n=1 Tax=Carnegiea gigantea TaxID=171969 RepID=A0A9Q1QMG2_9CARY|nr:hypothetical protein Cgig2_031741 [Carnegiea gigantea]
MEPQLSNSLLSFLLLLLSSAFSTAAAFPTTAPAAAPTTTNPFAFIRSSCNATLYPDVCYASLSRYADAVQRDPACLARVAIGVSLVRAHQARARFANMTGRADCGPDPRAAAALRDCRSTFSDAVSQMRDSLRQMRQLGLGPAGSGSAGEEEELIRFQLSNVQTWMSAALTNEDTCSDGFDDVEDGPLKEEKKI